MFRSTTNYPKLKTNLRLCINRMKLLEKKKTELAQKSRKEIADYIGAGKCERAKIRVEHIIREDYMVEALELIEMYCDLILSRFGLVEQKDNKVIDPSLAEAISSILWSCPYIESDIDELKVISEQFSLKYGKTYVELCRAGNIVTISEKLKHKLSIQPPPKILVEKYLVEISKNYNIPYDPDPQVVREYEQSKGIDALLDFTNFARLEPVGLPDGPFQPPQIVRPTGFVDFPQPPPAKNHVIPFNYPGVQQPPYPNSDNCPLPPASQNDSLDMNVDAPVVSSAPDIDFPIIPDTVATDDDLSRARGLSPNDQPPPSSYNNNNADDDDKEFQELTRRFQNLIQKK